ncbi:MAG: cytochrome c biogenesis protein CcsA [Nitrospirae bacterium]|nr:cytochrome c biogenesis protein CcsA [Nitrospirota bacterium]
MSNQYMIESVFNWAAVIIYAIAIIFNAAGVIFNKEQSERRSYFFVSAGLVSHGSALLYRWITSGHGPYMVRYEVISSDAWIALFLFLIFIKFYPKTKPASVIVFPVTLLALGLSLFFDPKADQLPPSLKSIWLVLHVSFIKIALGAMLIALAFSIFYVLKKHTRTQWLQKLPDLETIDVYAYRFAGFGFAFWTITTLAGSIWGYQSWGRFWAWDPIETWALITWIFFGVYLHLRHFFGLKGENAAYLFMLCFLLTLLSVFFVPFLESSIHSEYFK